MIKLAKPAVPHPDQTPGSFIFCLINWEHICIEIYRKPPNHQINSNSHLIHTTQSPNPLYSQIPKPTPQKLHIFFFIIIIFIGPIRVLPQPQPPTPTPAPNPIPFRVMFPTTYHILPFRPSFILHIKIFFLITSFGLFLMFFDFFVCFFLANPISNFTFFL